ncbi:MAG: hypothetical protein V4589_05525 [Bacteroidota bacterium]
MKKLLAPEKKIEKKRYECQPCKYGSNSYSALQKHMDTNKHINSPLVKIEKKERRKLFGISSDSDDENAVEKLNQAKADRDYADPILRNLNFEIENDNFKQTLKCKKCKKNNKMKDEAPRRWGCDYCFDCYICLKVENNWDDTYSDVHHLI